MQFLQFIRKAGMRFAAILVKAARLGIRSTPRDDEHALCWIIYAR